MNNILPIGHTLNNRYEIIELLSSNTGFGITYQVKDHNLHQQISVLKQLKQPTASKLNIEHLPIPDQQNILVQYWLLYLKLFDQETKALAKLGKNYNQIPTIYDKFEELGEQFYVQQYIDGNPLTQEVKTGQQLSEPQTISLLMEILEVFEYIQDPKNTQDSENPQGYSVIHRDIKPENIIRRKSDHKLVVIDFGLVQEVTIPGTQVVSIGGGTRGYIAPEIALGKASFASDIYAIGMIGVFAITGENPSANLDLDENWQKRPNVHVSSEFASVLNKMIHQDYHQRFRDAKDAKKALQDLLRTSVTPIPPRPTINWKLIISVISGIMIFAGVVITAKFLLNKPENQLITDLIVDGTAKSGELKSSDQKGLQDGKFYDVYTFNSQKEQYLTLEVIGENFRPVVTVNEPNVNDFVSVKDVSKQDQVFTASIELKPGVYKFKITSENGEIGQYKIKGWLSNK